jgi:hypothetical protein
MDKAMARVLVEARTAEWTAGDVVPPPTPPPPTGRKLFQGWRYVFGIQARTLTITPHLVFSTKARRSSK